MLVVYAFWILCFIPETPKRGIFSIPYLSHFLMSDIAKNTTFSDFFAKQSCLKFLAIVEPSWKSFFRKQFGLNTPPYDIVIERHLRILTY